ncbi:MAG: prepilin-type N-terminal cleavage/methylation domain-containing protein [Campylobacter sp.]|nr:prepilin-type N-terminal cleavage/methylation domain-containing protein [Campylobacter sp.]
MKKAFTLIELVIIIVVVGILAAAITPRLDKNPMIEAADQIASHIEYTKHLAMMNNNYVPTNPNWRSEQWAIVFNETGYSIQKLATTTPTYATNPSSPERHLDQTETPSLNLAKKYDMAPIAPITISFDSYGRPYVDGAKLDGTTDQVISITNNAGIKAEIAITPMTGMVKRQEWK